MIPTLPRSRLSSLAALAAVASLFGLAAARADCNEDLGALAQKRSIANAAIERNKKTHGGKIDPVAACPQLKALAAAQGAVVAYMQKNKAWCALPDDLVVKSAQTQASISGFAVKACGMVAKMKQMQTQAAAAQAAQAAAQAPQLKLPTGPL